MLVEASNLSSQRQAAMYYQYAAYMNAYNRHDQYPYGTQPPNGMVQQQQYHTHPSNMTPALSYYNSTNTVSSMGGTNSSLMHFNNIEYQHAVQSALIYQQMMTRQYQNSISHNTNLSVDNNYSHSMKDVGSGEGEMERLSGKKRKYTR